MPCGIVNNAASLSISDASNDGYVSSIQEKTPMLRRRKRRMTLRRRRLWTSAGNIVATNLKTDEKPLMLGRKRLPRI